MSNEAIVPVVSSDWPSTWPEWTKDCALKLEGSESAAFYLVEPGMPPWAEKAAMALAKLFLPTLTFDATQSGPYALGALVGHTERLLCSDFPKNPGDELCDRVDQAFEDRLKRILNRKAYARHQRRMRKLKPKLRAAGDRLTETTIQVVEAKALALTQIVGIAIDQPMPEKADFFEAYANALRTPLYTEEGRPIAEKNSSITSIHFILATYWRLIQRLRSVSQLYGFLCFFLGKSQVGDLERVKKLCFRLGLTLARRGRPRK